MKSGADSPGTPRHTLFRVFLAFLCFTCIKVMLFPAYHSTDLYVHRHWKALTYTLSLDQWYYDDRYVNTRHTLDYPPLFAYFEWFWSNNPATRWLRNHSEILNAECLSLLDDAYELNTSMDCIAFLRATVVLSDVMLWLGAWALVGNDQHKFFLIVLNPAFLWLDHIHFQYNGFLVGILMVSIGSLVRAQNYSDRDRVFHFYHLFSAITYSLLLTMKHLYLGLSLWYFAYLLRSYCFKPATMVNVPSFSWIRFHTLASVTLLSLSVPFLPMLLLSNEPIALLTQIFGRLFPFGRGLVHDYWAGNVWAIYVTLNKVLRKITSLELPIPSPLVVSLILFVTLLPGAFFAWKAAGRRSKSLLLTSLAFSALASFEVGYHVHEKAIVTAVIPVLAWGCDSILMETMSLFALLGLMPLLFQGTETALKLSSMFCYQFYLRYNGVYTKRELSLLRHIVYPVVVAVIYTYEFDGFYNYWGISIALLAGSITESTSPPSLLLIYGFIFSLYTIAAGSSDDKLSFAPLGLVSLTTAAGLLLCFGRVWEHLVQL